MPRTLPPVPVRLRWFADRTDDGLWEACAWVEEDTGEDDTCTISIGSPLFGSEDDCLHFIRTTLIATTHTEEP